MMMRPMLTVMNRARRRAPVVLTAVALAGCAAVGPDYQRPSAAAPATYKELAGWKPAEPADHVARGNWWEVFGDPQLNALVQQVQVSNQNVRLAEAQYRQAVALLSATRASIFPTVNATASVNRGQSATFSSATGTAVVTPGAPINTTERIGLTTSWEADVWGRIRRNIESNDTAAQASAADLQSALLSAQATLAQSYLQLRVNDAQRKLLVETAVGYERSLQITRNRYDAGVAARSDVTQAQAQLLSTQAQAIDLDVQRAQLEHAIAVLVGKAPADLKIAVDSALPALPGIPLGIPSELLERRPDIAGAERRVASANAQIGVAQAAFFPTLSLNASGGFQASSFSNLLTLPSRFWSLGPALALTVFDAGARSAQKERAIAGFDAAVASYRQTVLSGFQEVEDNLAALRVLQAEAKVQDEAARVAAESVVLTNNQYLAGTVSYLNVVSAQATSLAADRSSLDIAARRLLASVVLLKALGGGWSAPRP